MGKRSGNEERERASIGSGDRLTDLQRPSLLGYVRRHAASYITAILCVAGYQLVMNRIDWRVKSLVDAIYGQGPTQPITAGVMGIVAAALLGLVLRLANRWLFFSAAREAEFDLRQRLLESLYAKDLSFFGRIGVGDLMTRLGADVQQVRALLGFGVLHALNSVLAFASATQVMVSISPRLFLLTLPTVPVIVVVTGFLLLGVVSQSRVSQAALSDLTDHTQRHFSTIRLARSFGLEPQAELAFGASVDTYARASLRLTRLRSLVAPALGATSVLGLVVVGGYGARLLGHEAPQLTDGGFLAFLLAWTRLAWPLSLFATTIGALHRGRVSFARLTPLFEPHEAQSTTQTAAPRDLRVEGLSLELDGRRVLDDVSFHLPTGGRLAIVGRTGSGKTTIARLIAGFLRPSGGTVRIGDVPVSEVPREILPRWVGYAAQDPFLISDTIAVNVSLGHGATLSDARLAELLDAVRVRGEVARLPEGVHSVVGDRGVQLSGGQRQRVALARALASPAPLLVLDDPLSAVDAETAAAIVAELARTSRSLLLFTHQLSSAALCDCIVVLDAGRVVQAGTHDELMARPGLYAALAAEQRIADTTEPTRVEPLDAEGARAVASPSAPPTPSPGGLIRLLPFVRPDFALVAVATLGMAAFTLFTLLRPAVLGLLTSLGARGAPTSSVAAGLTALVLGSLAALCLQMIALQVAGARSAARLRRELFSRTRSFAMRFFDRNRIGLIVSRVVADVDAVIEPFNNGAFGLLGDAVSLVVIVILLATTEPRLALRTLAVFPVALVIGVIVRPRSQRAYRAAQAASTELQVELHDQIVGLEVLRASGAQGFMRQRFARASAAHQYATRNATMLDASLDACTDTCALIALAVLVACLETERARGAPVAFGTAVALQLYIGQLFDPLSLFVQRVSQLQLVVAASENIIGFLDQPELETDEPQPSTIPRSDEALALDHVSFAYRAGDLALDDVSLRVRPGERVALVGRTGAGKSTIAQLLLRLYDVEQGSVRVAGRDVREWPRHELRARFALVPQEVALHAGTILENIALDGRGDRARASAVLEALELGDWVAQRSGGLDARVVERGANFSAGERQLVAFARAMYRDAPYLVLDEATARLDSSTELKVQRALAKLLAGRTSLVIAHRLSTIEDSDRILVLELGRLVEEGHHEVLLRAGGVYARFHALQGRVRDAG